MQVVRDALCMRGSKDRALVVLEHGKPVRDVARVIGWVRGGRLYEARHSADRMKPSLSL
jgi:hypothetical protein